MKILNNLKDSPKEYAEELLKEIEKTLYDNSSISTNETQMDYENCTKELALFHIQQIYRFGDSLKLREPLMYFNAVEKEIKNLNYENLAHIRHT